MVGRESRRGSRGARGVVLGAALALLGACGGDDGGDPSGPSGDDPSGGVGPGSGAAPAGGPLGTGAPDGSAPNGDLPVDPTDGPEALAVEAPPDAAASPWLVYVSLFSNASRTDFGNASVELNRYADPVEFASHAGFYERDYIGELDRCVVRERGGASGGGEPNPRLVSGGETLLIAAPDGSSFAELPRVTAQAGTRYDADGALPGPVPPGATLTVPGDAFPAVEAYPLLSPEPLVRLSPVQGEPPSTASEYRWVPADGAGFVKLDFLAAASDGTSRGFPVTCFAYDDGEFELTDEAIEALAGVPETISLRYSRVATRLEWSDGIAFFVDSEISE